MMRHQYPRVLPVSPGEQHRSPRVESGAPRGDRATLTDRGLSLALVLAVAVFCGGIWTVLVLVGHGLFFIVLGVLAVLMVGLCVHINRHP